MIGSWQRPGGMEMALPRSVEARQYYRCALQRFEDAEVLLRAAHTTGAVYLAGYAIECMLKALILDSLAPATRAAMLGKFRGARAHDYEWLRGQYVLNRGARPPGGIAVDFTLVDGWSTDLRYVTRSLRSAEAEEFLQAAKRILDWADGRL